MNQEERLNDDSKGQGIPPPYTDGVPPVNPGPPPAVKPKALYMATAEPAVVPVVIQVHQMGPKPTPKSCPSCNEQIVTRVEHKPSTKTHLFAFLLFLIGCWPCVIIPYCTASCMNADHYCPKCNAYLGSYKL